MNTEQFKRQLRELGARFEQGSKHTKVYFNGKQTTIPRHKEISEQLVKLIKRQLGIK
jgi:mRNA interferase HicA